MDDMYDCIKTEERADEALGTEPFTSAQLPYKSTSHSFRKTCSFTSSPFIVLSSYLHFENSLAVSRTLSISPFPQIPYFLAFFSALN